MNKLKIWQKDIAYICFIALLNMISAHIHINCVIVIFQCVNVFMVSAMLVSKVMAHVHVKQGMKANIVMKVSDGIGIKLLVCPLSNLHNIKNLS